MPNICIANVAVRGLKDNVLEFERILKGKYSYDKYDNYEGDRYHFYRIFNVEDDGPLQQVYGLIYTKSWRIECAWSVYVCMFAGELTYYASSKHSTPFVTIFDNYLQRQDKHGVCIEEVSRKLNLDIDIISEEPSLGFSEHYIFEQGKLILKDEREFRGYYFSKDDIPKSYEEFMKQYPDNYVLKEEFNCLIQNKNESGEDELYVEDYSGVFSDDAYQNYINNPRLNTESKNMISYKHNN